jgi:hypothetical protein
MAQRILILDDFDGTENAETRRFTIDSRHFEIDLTDTNYAGFLELVADYTDKARDVTPSRGYDLYASVDQSAVRSWAIANAIPGVNVKGRVPGWLIERYRREQVAAEVEAEQTASDGEGDADGEAAAEGDDSAGKRRGRNVA